MQILIGADLVPTESNFAMFRSGDASSLVGEALLQILKSADYRIFNLEVPLSDSRSPIEKCGPALIAPSDTLAGYRALGVDFVTLANNHILDQGPSGLRDTVQNLEKARIAYVGAGTPEDAKQARFVELGDKKIGIYACAEREFSIAEEGKPGANPFDPLESLDHILNMKAACDYAIVLYHGGREHYPYPSPNLQKTCRKIVEKGADLVLCQHSHCIGCEEKYEGSTIVYGQGNFLFDACDLECWQSSLLVSLNESLKVSYVPLKKAGNTVRLAEGAEADEILSAFARRSEEIRRDGFLNERYVGLSAELLNSYLYHFSGMKQSFFYRVLNKLSGHRLTPWLLKKKYTKERILTLQNHIECEAHREVLLCALKQQTKANESK